MLEQLGFGRGTTNEPFLAETIISNCKQFDLKSVDHYLAEIIRVWRSKGVCFLKISWDALFWLYSDGVLESLVPRSAFIWTKRRDKVAQAVSYVKALQTNSFFERADQVGQEGKRWDAIWNGDETLYEVGKEVHNSFVAEARLGYFLAIFGLDALELYFEDIICDLPGTCEKVSYTSGTNCYSKRAGAQAAHIHQGCRSSRQTRMKRFARLFLRSFNSGSRE